MNNKEYKWRREGMIYAYSRIKEIGFEEFAKEMKRRGMLRMDITITDDEIKEAFKVMADNMSNNMLPLFYLVLADNFGFTKEKLTELHEKFNAEFANIMNLDYMGEHYVTLSDYQKEVNERYGFNFDLSIGDTCQELADQESEQMHYVKIEKLIEMLEIDGFPAASLHLKKKIGR